MLESVKGTNYIRLEMILQTVESHFGERPRDISCLDVGGHEGFYLLQMANEFKRVHGIKVRKQSIEKAELVRVLQEASTVSFGLGDCYNIESMARKPVELVLFLGFLYHLDNPIQVILDLSRATKDLCVFGAQVVDEMPEETQWGSKDWCVPDSGSFALINKRGEFDAENLEAGSLGVVLCPSLSAVYFTLEAAGFRNINVISPSSNGYERLIRGKRVVVAASK